MATTADIRNGMVFEYKGQRMKVIQFLHVKPGKGGAFVRTKLKNIITGQVVDVTFRSGEKIKPIYVESKEMQYLYGDDVSYVFMDMKTYNQINVPLKVIEEERKFLKEGEMVELTLVDEDVIGIKLPVFVELEVTETDPGMRGDTATGGTKPATLETGFTVTVPLFINVGDMIKVDTRTGEYVERRK